jgi:hypothetical protein
MRQVRLYIILFLLALLPACSSSKQSATNPTGNPIVIHNINHRGIDHGKLMYVIKSPVVEQDSLRVYSYFNQGLSATIYNSDNNINISAQSGNLDSRSNLLTLTGNINANTSDGVSISTNYLQWSQAQNTLITQQANIYINDNNISVGSIQNNGNMHEFNLSNVKVMKKDIELTTQQAYLDTGISKAIMPMPLSGKYNEYLVNAKSGEYDMKGKIFDMDDVEVSNNDKTIKLQARTGTINTKNNSSSFSQINKLNILNNKNSYDVITDTVNIDTLTKIISASNSQVISNKDKISSSKLSYSYDKKAITFDTNVKVENSGKNPFVLQSNLLNVDTATNAMNAKGNINLTYKDKVITGDKLEYASSTITISDNVIMTSSKGEKLVTKKVIIDTVKDSIKTIGRSKARVIVE